MKTCFPNNAINHSIALYDKLTDRNVVFHFKRNNGVKLFKIYKSLF